MSARVSSSTCTSMCTLACCSTYLMSLCALACYTIHLISFALWNSTQPICCLLAPLHAAYPLDVSVHSGMQLNPLDVFLCSCLSCMSHTQHGPLDVSVHSSMQHDPIETCVRSCMQHKPLDVSVHPCKQQNRLDLFLHPCMQHNPHDVYLHSACITAHWGCTFSPLITPFQTLLALNS